VEQVGAPLDLDHRPAKRFVAGFIGSPAMNFVEGMVTEDGRGVVLGHARQQRLELPRPLQSGRKVWIGLRPEHLQLGGAGKQQSFDVQVDTVESTGSMTFIETEADPTSLIIAQSGTAEVEGGTTITVGINSEDIYLFDIQTDLAL
jgi:multiple sugar transport system ATP-binding protein